MRKFIYLLFLASITAMAVGCSDNIIEENRVLKLDEAEVTFTDAKQSKLIKVTTDVNNDFTAVWQGDKWGDAKVESGKLTIYVDANIAIEDRTSTVYVKLVKGGLIKEIKVTQQGEESSLGSLPDELLFAQSAERKEIKIFTNLTDWQVDFPAKEWGSVITDRTEGTITVDVLENILEEERSFTIILSSATAGLTKDIKITQSGVLTHILPYLKVGATGPEIMDFEKSRGSIYKTGRNPYMFTPLSKIITDIRYYTDAESYYSTGVINLSINPKLFDKNVYAELLIENEYEFAFLEPSIYGDIQHHWKESDKSLSSIFVGPYANYIEFNLIEKKPNNPVQSGPIPTFPSYPLEFRTLLLQLDFDMIKEWEAANGGILQKDISNERVSVFFTENDPAVAARIYEMTGTHMLPGVTSIAVVSRDMSLAMYPCVRTNILTNEFEEMLASNGWVRAPDSGPSTMYYYRKEDENLRLQVYASSSNLIPAIEGKEVAYLSIIPLKAPTGFSSILSRSKAPESKPMSYPFRENKATLLGQIAQ